MRLRPRHYVLLAVILCLGIYNIYRLRHARSTALQTVVVAPASVPVSNAWDAFDKAAALRDASDAQFSPALANLQQTSDAAAAAGDPTAGDVKGCQTWLQFYRQAVLHPSPDPAWKQRSATHLDTCTKTHHDAG